MLDILSNAKIIKYIPGNQAAGFTLHVEKLVSVRCTFLSVYMNVEHLREINGNEQIESRNTQEVLHYMTCMNVLLYSFLLSFICSLIPIHMNLTYRYTRNHICIVHGVDMEGDPTFLGLSTFNYLGVS